MEKYNFQTMTFSEIKHKLPEDCWAYQRNQLNNGELEEEVVWFHSGDLHLPHLNLEKLARLEDDFFVFILIVEGDLFVKDYIYNEDTDGAPGIIVLGDLLARNMAVGGQEIYVRGNLYVQEMFWGHYNHGMLTVKGEAAAQLFLTTDEYSCTIDGESKFALKPDDLDELPKDILADGCFIEVDETEEPYLNREHILYLWENKQQVLFPGIIEAALRQENIPYKFSSHYSVTHEHLETLTHPSILPAEPDENNYYKYEFWIEEWFFRGLVLLDSDGHPKERMVYMEKEDEYAAVLHTERLGAAGTEGREGSNWSPIACSERNMTGDDTEWRDYDHNKAEVISLLFDEGWSILLYGVSQYYHMAELILAEQIEELLALPLVEPYDDYYSEDRSGFWAQGLYCAFCQEGALYEGEPEPAQLKITREYKDSDGNNKQEGVLYKVKRCMDGSRLVEIEYNEDEDNDEGWISISYTNAEKAQICLRLFQSARSKLLRLNSALLDGETPYFAEDFALDYWAEKEYIPPLDDTAYGDMDASSFLENSELDEEIKQLARELFAKDTEEMQVQEMASLLARSDKNESYSYNGCSFKKITIAQARAILKKIEMDESDLWDVQWGDIYSTGYWLLADGPVTLDALVMGDMDRGNEDNRLMGIIINGDLEIKNRVDNVLLEEGCDLIVLGNLRAKVCCFGTSVGYIQGSLTSEMLLCEGRYGWVTVQERLECPIISSDYPIDVLGTLQTEKILGDGLSLEEEEIDPTHESLSEVFTDEVLTRGSDEEEMFIDYERLIKALSEGRSVLRS